MRATTLIKAIALTALLAGMSAAGVKYVAVVETEIDAQSGASANLNPAEVREITAEIRRQAIENLPSDRYSVMTSETVQSMGGAVLEECADENCVITLGSKIGADYIVRGTIGKFQTRFTLKVEMYETDNGTLVATSEPVRTENVGEILDMATGACGKMFRKFAGAQSGSGGTTLQSKAESENVALESKTISDKKRKVDYYFAPKYQLPVGTPVSWGGFNGELGLVWGKGAFFGIDIGGGESKDPYGDFIGLGLSLGNLYDFGNQLQLVYGGSVGFWWYHGEGEYNDSRNIIAPFVKFRWNFVELMYRGFLGFEGSSNVNWLRYDAITFNHQLMLGLYFSTSKRTTR